MQRFIQWPTMSLMPVLAKWPGDLIQWSESESHGALQSTACTQAWKVKQGFVNGPELLPTNLHLGLKPPWFAIF